MKKTVLLLLIVTSCFSFDCLNEQERKTREERYCCEKIRQLNTDFRAKTLAGWKREIRKGEVKPDMEGCIELYFARRNSNSIGGTL
jgi:hypothetical protein